MPRKMTKLKLEAWIKRMFWKEFSRFTKRTERIISKAEKKAKRVGEFKTQEDAEACVVNAAEAGVKNWCLVKMSPDGIKGMELALADIHARHDPEGEQDAENIHATREDDS